MDVDIIKENGIYVCTVKLFNNNEYICKSNNINSVYHWFYNLFDCKYDISTKINELIERSL